MAQKIMLKNAMKEMAAGSKKAFHTFYTGTAQYVYQSAFYLYANEQSAREFMVDFYQYLFLHLPEYTYDQSLENWISSLVRQRFSELSIGKKIPDATLQQRMTTVTLDKETRNQIWRMLEMRISFPPEKVKLPYSLIAVILSLFAFLLLLGYHYKDVLFPTTSTKLNASDLAPSEQTDDADASTQEEEDEDETASDPSISDGGGDNPETEQQETSDDDLVDELTNQFNESLKTDSSASDSETTDKNTTSEAYRNATNDSHQADTPTVEQPSVDHPTVNHPGNGSDNDSSDSSSSTSQLEDLELNLHYGDSLTDRGILSDYE